MGIQGVRVKTVDQIEVLERIKWNRDNLHT